MQQKGGVGENRDRIEMEWRLKQEGKVKKRSRYKDWVQNEGGIRIGIDKGWNKIEGRGLGEEKEKQ